MSSDCVEKGDSRIQSVDILKGAAIIGVVVAHLVLIQNTESFSDSSFRIGELFYAALPMFFVLSGYFYRSEGFVTGLKNRVLPLVIGLIAGTVILTFVMYVYLLLLGYDLSGSDLLGDIVQIIIGKAAFEDLDASSFTGETILNVYDVSLPFYFIQIMAVGYLIFLPIADVVLKDCKRLVIAIIILLSITCAWMELVHMQLPFYAQMGPVVAAFYLTGAFIGRYNLAEYLENGYKERRYWLIFILMVVAAILCIAFIPTGMNLIDSEFGPNGGYSVFTFYVTTMACGMVLMYLAAFVSHVKWATEIITFAGRESLYIFFLHIFVAKMLVAPFVTLDVQTWIPIDSVPLSILLAIITIVIIVVAVIVLRKVMSRAKPLDSY